MQLVEGGRYKTVGDRYTCTIKDKRSDGIWNGVLNDGRTGTWRDNGELASSDRSYDLVTEIFKGLPCSCSRCK